MNNKYTRGNVKGCEEQGERERENQIKPIGKWEREGKRGSQNVLSNLMTSMRAKEKVECTFPMRLNVHF